MKLLKSIYIVTNYNKDSVCVAVVVAQLLWGLPSSLDGTVHVWNTAY